MVMPSTQKNSGASPLRTLKNIVLIENWSDLVAIPGCTSVGRFLAITCKKPIRATPHINQMIIES